jgi:tetratricopeptide (TPR) repeat protein
MFKGFVIPLIFLFLFTSQAVAQEEGQAGIDSLQQVILRHPAHDTTRVSLLSRQSYLYFGVNPEDGLKKGNEALAIAREIHWQKGEAMAFSAMGADYWAQNNYSAAADFFLKSVDIYKTLGDKTMIGPTMINMGVINEAIGNHHNAVKYYTIAATEFEAIGNYNGAIGALYNASFALIALRQYNEAVRKIREGIALSEKHKIVSAYIPGKMNLCQYYIALKEYDSATILLNELVSGTYGLLPAYRTGKCYEMLASIMAGSGRYNDAISYLSKAMSNYQSIHYTLQMSICQLQMVDDYISIACDHRSANKQSTALMMAEKYANAVLNNGEACKDLRQIMDANKFLSRICEIRHDYRNAFKYFTIAKKYSDSLTREENQQETLVKTIDFAYQRSKDSLHYDNEIATMKLKGYYNQQLLENYRNKQTILYILLGSLLIIVVVVPLLLRRTFQNEQLKATLDHEILGKKLIASNFERKMNELSMVALQSQMNPHFIFNCLNSIRLLIEQNEADAASLYLTKFARLIRVILECSSREFISVADELESLRLYLELEKLRFKNKLQYVFEISPDIDTEQTELPPMLVQPFIENAIWHGLMYRENGGTVIIRFSNIKDEPAILVEIEDDGVGIEQSKNMKQRQEQESRGIAFTRERLALLGKKTNRDWALSQIELKNENGAVSGTLVTIKIPYL